MSKEKKKDNASSPRNVSQFAGAAAMFQKKEKDLLEKNGSLPALSPKPAVNRFGNSSFSNFAMSPGPINNKRSSKSSTKRQSLDAPPFVSPGVAASRPSWKKSSSALSTPQPKKVTKSPRSANGIGLLPLTPDSDGKPKVDGKSWRDKPAISFQATSPGSLKKTKAASRPPHGSPLYAGSFLNKGKDAQNNQKAFRKQDSAVAPLVETPDIAIEVKIPDIDKKIRARRESRIRKQVQQKEENVPEWKLKFQEREANRIRKENERVYNAANKIQATVLRFIARARYPILLEESRERLARIREKERIAKLKLHSAIRIQSIWRRFLPRKRFLYVQECRRRRERNQKEIKRMKKVIKQMPKDTKAEIKELKKTYTEKKKDFKKQLKKEIKDEEKRLKDIKKSGKNMIAFLQEENKKLMDKQDAMKQEYKLLEKQFDILTAKSDEIAENFISLQKYVARKNESLRKNEINSQKCRHRYLPKHRAMLLERDKHCVVERKIAMLYRQQLKEVVRHITKKCKNKELVEEAIDGLATVEAEIAVMPKLELPESLQTKMDRVTPR